MQAHCKTYFSSFSKINAWMTGEKVEVENWYCGKRNAIFYCRLIYSILCDLTTVTTATKKIKHSVGTSMLFLGEMIKQTQTSNQTPQSAQEPRSGLCFPTQGSGPQLDSPPLAAMQGSHDHRLRPFAREHVNSGSDPFFPLSCTSPRVWCEQNRTYQHPQRPVPVPTSPLLCSFLLH